MKLLSSYQVGNLDRQPWGLTWWASGAQRSICLGQGSIYLIQAWLQALEQLCDAVCIIGIRRFDEVCCPMLAVYRDDWQNFLMDVSRIWK